MVLEEFVFFDFVSAPALANRRNRSDETGSICSVDKLAVETLAQQARDSPTG